MKSKNTTIAITLGVVSLIVGSAIWVYYIFNHVLVPLSYGLAGAPPLPYNPNYVESALLIVATVLFFAGVASIVSGVFFATREEKVPIADVPKPPKP